MSDNTPIYWEHGPDCWQRYAVDVGGDIALSPEDDYCSWSLERRLADDPTDEPSTCGGRWVRLVEVTDDES